MKICDRCLNDVVGEMSVAIDSYGTDGNESSTRIIDLCEKCVAEFGAVVNCFLADGRTARDACKSLTTDQAAQIDRLLIHQ